MVVNERNSIVYFEYDKNEEDWLKRVGGSNGKKSALNVNFLRNEIDIVAWHFDYDDGSLLFIDENNEIYRLELTT